MQTEISFFIAVFAGLLSFLSPCVLPLIPSYISYITGISFEVLSKSQSQIRKKVILHSVLFILGFSVVFIILGASITFLGKLLGQHLALIRKIGGILIILFGLQIIGVFNIGFLQQEKKIHLSNKPIGYFGSFLMGSIFAFGWTPCAGPILATILLYAGTSQKLILGIGLLIGYSLGLGIPFIISGLLFSQFLFLFGVLKKYIRVFTVIGGVFLVAIGALLFTGGFESLIAALNNWLYPLVKKFNI